MTFEEAYHAKKKNIYIFQLLCYNPSPNFSSHVRMLIFLPALNLKLSVAPSAPIIANYLLQPQATCWLASSNQTLLFSRQGCEVHQKQHSNSLNIPSCHSFWVKVFALCLAWCQEVGWGRFSVGDTLSNGLLSSTLCHVIISPVCLSLWTKACSRII